MPLTVRPLNSDDLDDLKPLDTAYAGRVGAEPIVDEGSLSFFERTGHAFVLEAEGATRGYLLAQSVWDGRRPTVSVVRFVAVDEAGRLALLEALTKSAYDAGVYDIRVTLPKVDEAGRAALETSDYRSQQLLVFSRVLGSRSRSVQ